MIVTRAQATNTPRRTCLAVILAAGEGTRMKSARPKVLHELGGVSLLGHVLQAVAAAGADEIVVVVGPDREDVAAEARKRVPGLTIVEQRERLGTAHAVLQAREALARAPQDVLVAFADTPLLTPQTFARLRAALADGAAVAALGFEAADPTGYGRLLTEGGRLIAIREHKDASEAERAVTLCNAGLMALDGTHALSILDAIGNDNAQSEYYLPDAVAIAVARGLATAVVVAPEDEVQGINDRVQLARVEALLQNRLREQAMRAGVTLVDPATVHLSADADIARDVTIEPFVVIGPGTRIGEGALIHSFSHIEGADVGARVVVGPHARLRPGAVLEEGARVGNFVELKNTRLGPGAKVNHLTYLGDAQVGAAANIGAGTITCNYDGFGKYPTTIGAGAFIGSNSSLVAPVTIADGAYVGSGSVITDDVPADALAVARGRQVVKPGWAADFRAKARKSKT
jgi:bifunctional UDP-N-acetylglucosamine pyrophosphorylase/glucosamine-1-phosphate N-acetyltransferase